jgi:hypothetical protein
MKKMISPNQCTDDIKMPLSIEDKIKIFHDRIYGWQLHIAEVVINGTDSSDKETNIKGIADSGFATLQILMSYFETIAVYENGITDRKKDPNHKFTKGVLSVFPDLCKYDESVRTTFINKLYAGVRCGLYHNAMTKAGISISSTYEDVILFEPLGNGIGINPHLLPKTLLDHFDQYITRLYDPKETILRQNFEKSFDTDNSI